MLEKKRKSSKIGALTREDINMLSATFLTTPMHNIFTIKSNSFLKQLGLTIAGAFLLALAAQLSIPLTPVPITFQSATVIMIGLAVGPRQGAYIISTYLLAGALGLPVFADLGFGIANLFSPRAGYLLGFLPAVIASGYLAQRGFAKSILGSFIAAIAGASIIFACGISVLSLFVGFNQAIMFGLMPFVSSEIVKLCAVAAVAPRFWKNSN